MTESLDAHEVMPDQLRTSWFSHVANISNLGLQRKTWLDITNQNPYWSYIEFVCSYPDQDQLSYAYKQAWLSRSEFETLSELRHILLAYSPPQGNAYDSSAILDDPAWHAVAEAAERARRRLLSITVEPVERETLLSTK